EGRLPPSAFTVVTAAASGPGSLRQAILAADASRYATASQPAVINFAIGSGAQSISLLSPLPDVTVPVVVNGQTQSGYKGGRPLVELNGAQAGASADGLRLLGGYSAVEGLVIDRFGG